MKKRECQLYFAIFGESLKAEIKAYALQICCLSCVYFFVTIEYNSLGKLWFQAPFSLVLLLITAR